MNKREAIQAMLDGKKVAIRGCWVYTNYLYIDEDGNCVDEDADIIDITHFGKDGWTIYSPPKKLVKYYRPDIIKPLNEPPYKSAVVEFYKTKEASAFFVNTTEVLMWEEIEVEE